MGNNINFNDVFTITLIIFPSDLHNHHTKKKKKNDTRRKPKDIDQKSPKAGSLKEEPRQVTEVQKVNVQGPEGRPEIQNQRKSSDIRLTREDTHIQISHITGGWTSFGICTQMIIPKVNVS